MITARKKRKWDVHVQEIALDCIVGHAGDEIFKENSRTKVREGIKLFFSRNSGFKGKLSERTIYRWVKHYRLFGEAPADTIRREKIFNAKYRRGAQKSSSGRSWTRESTESLRKIINQEPWLYLDEIRQKLFLETGKMYHMTSISRQLRYVLKFSLNVISEKAIQQCQIERANYQFSREVHIKHPNMCVFIDGTQKSKNASRRRRFWGPQGQPSVAYTKFGDVYDRRYTMIAAADVDGFIVEACHVYEREHGPDDDYPFHDTLNTEKFEYYIEHFLCPVLGNYALREPRSIVFLDNAAIHFGSRIEDLIRATGAIIMYTAPYSPDLNPIEFMFSSYKKILKRLFAQGGDVMDHHMKALLESISPIQARNFFRKAKVPGCEAYEDEDDDDDDMEVLLALLLNKNYN